MKTRRLTIGAVAVAALAGCSGSSGGPAATQTPIPVTTTSPAASPTPGVPSPTPTSDSTALAPNATYFGYIKSVDTGGSTARLRFDRALLYTGSAANAQAAARGDETPVPNDYYIVNDNPLLRTLPISPSVVLSESIEIRNALGKNDFAGNNIVGPLNDLVDALAAQPKSIKHTPFHIHLDAAGRIDKITEQFVP